MRTHPLLTAAADAGVRLGLERVEGLLRFLGSPHLAVPSVHVAGTNGKGSVSSMVAAALTAGGLRTGLFTSPHLQHVNERVRVDGVPISDDALAALLEHVSERAAAWMETQDRASEGPPLTYFELMTVVAMVHFAAIGVDMAVFEVGLGGRLDATNTLSPRVTAITTVGLDHQDRLGPDLSSIAGEKAGIIKRGVPCVVGRLALDALRVVRVTAAGLDAPLEILGADFDVDGGPGGFQWSAGPRLLEGLQVGLVGQHQVDNAAVAIQVLAHACPELPTAAIRAGLRDVVHPGRLEWLAPDLLVDGAHNNQSAQALAQTLREMDDPRPRVLLLGAGGDKDLHAIGAALAPVVSRILTTRCAHPRALEPGQVASALESLQVPVLPAGPIEQALPLARDQGALVVVAGSLFLVGAVRDLVNPGP